VPVPPVPEYFDVSVMVVLVILLISHQVSPECSPVEFSETKSLAASDPVRSSLVATEVLPFVNVRVPESAVGAGDLAQRTSSSPDKPVLALSMVL